MTSSDKPLHSLEQIRSSHLGRVNRLHADKQTRLTAPGSLLGSVRGRTWAPFRCVNVVQLIGIRSLVSGDNAAPCPFIGASVQQTDFSS